MSWIRDADSVGDRLIVGRPVKDVFLLSSFATGGVVSSILIEE